MDSSLPEPSLDGLLAHWTIEPVALVVAVGLTAWYVRSLVAVRSWPVRRTLGFGLGVLVLVWTTCGFPQVYARSLFWDWTTQVMLLWFVVPLLLLAGRPLHLAQQRYGDRVTRALQARPLRVLANPLVGPALVPILSALLFFGPAAGWAISSPAAGWPLHLILLVAGLLLLLPIVGIDDGSSSLAVGLGLAIGMFELVLDAIPGIALRLHSGIATDYFQHRLTHSWTPAAIHDQNVAGNIVWCVAEVIDLPFLALVFRRWLRTDAREAADVDAVLEAERVARGEDESDVPKGDVPWWLSDPTMQDRFRRG
jgi:cytochrome c oxidase assembly factor CtaG